MMNRIYPVDLSRILDKGGIYIEQLQDGFDRYPYEIIEISEEESLQLLYDKMELNGEENSYFDFYYSRLTKSDKEQFLKRITEEEKDLLKRIETDSKGIFYPLKKELIPFLNRITSQEVLFSTFYFTKFPCTIWGNYGLKYPIFYSLEKSFESSKV